MTDAKERDSATPRRRTAPATGKRASGESSIYQDEDGRWHGFVSMGRKENGRRDRRHVSGAKRADVVTKMRALENKRDAGIVLEAGAGAVTVGGWLDHWLSTIAVRRVRPTTLEGYESKVRVHIRPALGHHGLERLQPEHLEQFYAAKLAAGLARRRCWCATGSCPGRSKSPNNVAGSFATSRSWSIPRRCLSRRWSR
jgi:integrase